MYRATALGVSRVIGRPRATCSLILVEEMLRCGIVSSVSWPDGKPGSASGYPRRDEPTKCASAVSSEPRYHCGM